MLCLLCPTYGVKTKNVCYKMWNRISNIRCRRQYFVNKKHIHYKLLIAKRKQITSYINKEEENKIEEPFDKQNLSKQSVSVLADKRRNIFLKNLLIARTIGSMGINEIKYFKPRSQSTLQKMLISLKKAISSDLVTNIKLYDFFRWSTEKVTKIYIFGLVSFLRYFD